VKSSGYSNILITGGAGFVGSNLAVAFQQRYPQSDITCLDNLKRRGSELNLPRLQAAGIRFVHGDIRNREDLDLNQNVDLLIECSAEPSVLAGFDNSPDYLINTNLVGTVNCLEVARRQKADMIFLSTGRLLSRENRRHGKKMSFYFLFMPRIAVGSNALDRRSVSGACQVG